MRGKVQLKRGVQESMYSSGLVKENPSKAPGSMAAMMLASTGLSLTGSFVNSGSKLSWFFLPFWREKKENITQPGVRSEKASFAVLVRSGLMR